MAVFPKWILEDGKIVIGKVTYHYQLCSYDGPLENQRKHVSGGGAFLYNPEDDSFLLYGISSDFSQCEREAVQFAVDNGWVGPVYDDGLYAGHCIMFSTKLKLEDALVDYVVLSK